MWGCGEGAPTCTSQSNPEERVIQACYEVKGVTVLVANASK